MNNLAYIDEYKLKSDNIPMTLNMMLAFIATSTASMERELKKYYKTTEETVTTSKARNSLDAGIIDNEWISELEAMEQANEDDELQPLILLALIHVANKMAKKLAYAIDETVVFSPADQMVIDYLRQWNNLTVTRFNAQREKGLIEVLNIALGENWSAKTTADLMKNTINLTQREAKSLAKKYAQLLESGDSRKVANAKIKRMADKIKNYRVRRITKTELTRAYGEANQIELQQSINNGKIGSASKTWVRTLFDDARNHRNSIENDGITIPINQSFPDGSPYPQEINENCYLTYQVKKNGAIV